MENRLLDTPVEDIKKRLLTPPTTSEEATALTELMYSMEVAIDGGTFPPGVGAEKMFCADMEPYLNAARVLLEEWENKEPFGLDLPLKVFLLSHLQDGKGLPSPADEDLANILGDADVTRRVQQGGTLTLNEERALAKALDIPPHCCYNTPSFLPNIHQAPRRGELCGRIAALACALLCAVEGGAGVRGEGFGLNAKRGRDEGGTVANCLTRT